MFALQINLTVITISNTYSLLEQQQHPNPVNNYKLYLFEKKCILCIVNILLEQSVLVNNLPNIYLNFLSLAKVKIIYTL